MIVIHSKLFFCQPDMTSSPVLPKGSCTHFFMTDSERDFLIVFHSNIYLRWFRNNRFYCKSDMTSWFLRQGALQAIFHDDLWKSDHDFLIVIHSNALSAMHGFWDSEVLLPTGYDVIVISLLGVSHAGFVDRIWKSDPCFIIMVHWHISRISYCFEVIQHFILDCNCKFWSILGVFLS